MACGWDDWKYKGLSSLVTLTQVHDASKHTTDGDAMRASTGRTILVPGSFIHLLHVSQFQSFAFAI
jgi:hypothetical protein